MQLYTVQLGQWRLVPPDVELVDTTVKSGAKFLAPTWDMVMGVKDGSLTEEQYTVQYYAMMRESYRRNKEQFLALLGKPAVALGCYCKPGDFCHRLLLIDILKRIAIVNDIHFEYVEEIKSAIGD
ncbi:MAG: hypothetical protein CL678_15875 [Bdellovibrionaceae bacterium]|nr:hypothetical protein [Pseudobdellovibrionaceae bacterium]